MTPYELGLYIQEYMARIKREQEEKIRIAYLTAVLQRVEKMPPISDFIGSEEKEATKSPETMLDTVKMLNAAMGGTVS